MDARARTIRFLSYAELADRLIPYVRDMGFTHIELMPVSEFPFDGSWGYQPIGLYRADLAVRHTGGLRQFRRPLPRGRNRRAGGLGLGAFPDRRRTASRASTARRFTSTRTRGSGFHKDWNTLIYNYGRREVLNFLLANALFWLERFGIDGLRVDAVASMLYLDYSREPGEWMPNKFGGNENLEAIAFLKRLNELVFSERPGTTTIAEEFDGLARRVAPDLSRRPRLRLQMEHGLDARHAELHARGPDPPPVSSRQADFRPALRLLGELRAAAVTRRGGARQRLADRQDAGRPLAEIREFARLFRVHVGPSRQEAAVHGRRVRAGGRVEPRAEPRLAFARRRHASRRAVSGARPQPALP